MDALPPNVPSIQQNCAGAQRINPDEAERLLRVMQGKLPRTALVGAVPAPMCGLVQLRLENGNVAFTDKAGRYLIVGLMVDTTTGQFVSHPTSVQATQEVE